VKPLYQFSLRSFFLLLSCIAVVLAVFARYCADVAARNAAILAIKDELGVGADLWSANGGLIENPQDGDPVSIHVGWLDSDRLVRFLSRCARVKSVRELSIWGATWSPEVLANVPRNPQVRTLHIQSARGLTLETCLLLVSKFPNICELDVYQSDIRQDGFCSLRALHHLRKIELGLHDIPGEDIVDACLFLPGLEYLTIRRTDLSGELHRLNGLPRLEVLHLHLSDYSEGDLAGFLDHTTCRRVCVTGGTLVNLDVLETRIVDKEKLTIFDWGPGTTYRGVKCTRPSEK